MHYSGRVAVMRWCVWSCRLGHVLLALRFPFADLVARCIRHCFARWARSFGFVSKISILLMVIQSTVHFGPFVVASHPVHVNMFIKYTSSLRYISSRAPIVNVRTLMGYSALYSIKARCPSAAPINWHLIKPRPTH